MNHEVNIRNHICKACLVRHIIFRRATREITPERVVVIAFVISSRWKNHGFLPMPVPYWIAQVAWGAAEVVGLNQVSIR